MKLKEKILFFALLAFGFIYMFILGMLYNSITTNAFYFEPFETDMIATAYCTGEITASGEPVREGICAVAREYMGLTALVWTIDDNGKPKDFIGYFECLDTGYGRETGEGQSKIFPDKTKGTIEAGQCIDIYYDNIDKCYDFMELTRGRVYVRFLYAVG